MKPLWPSGRLRWVFAGSCEDSGVDCRIVISNIGRLTTDGYHMSLQLFNTKV